MKLERVSELRTLAMLLRQGEAASRALQRLAARSPAWRAAADRAEQGGSLAAALDSVLPPGSAAVLAEADDAPAVLDELASLLQQSCERQRRWGAVLIYPLFLILVALGVVLLGGLILQPFIQLFEGMNVRLPMTTQIVLGSAKGVRNPALVVLCGPPLLGVLWLIFGWPRGRLLLPIVGHELRHQEAQGFLTWLAFLMERKVPLPAAVRCAAQTGSAEPMRRQLLGCAEELEKGAQVEDAVGRLTWFPPLARWLLASSFRTAAPGPALAEAARLLARDSELQATNSAAVIETALMIALGLAVGFVVLSLFLPLYQLIGNLG